MLDNNQKAIGLFEEVDFYNPLNMAPDISTTTEIHLSDAELITTLDSKWWQLVEDKGRTLTHFRRSKIFLLSDLARWMILQYENAMNSVVK